MAMTAGGLRPKSSASSNRSSLHPTEEHALAGSIVVYDRSVEADFAVELGVDDETLDMPWEGGEAGPRYSDLKHHPELLSHIEEADRVEELGEFLLAMNSSASPFETAKCDVWSSTEMKPVEEIFHATH